MSDKLTAEKAPMYEVGPVCTDMDQLRQWMLTQHVKLCKKGGVDCKSCDMAESLGIQRCASA